MCLGMVFTTSGMLTKQSQCSRGFGNAADEFRNAIDGLGRPGMVWVWSGTVQVGSGL